MCPLQSSCVLSPSRRSFFKLTRYFTLYFHFRTFSLIQEIGGLITCPHIHTHVLKYVCKYRIKPFHLSWHVFRNTALSYTCTTASAPTSIRMLCATEDSLVSILQAPGLGLMADTCSRWPQLWFPSKIMMRGYAVKPLSLLGKQESINHSFIPET